MAIASNNGDAADAQTVPLSSDPPPPAPGSRETVICARCQEPLLEPGRGAGCPRCMMRLAFSEEDLATNGSAEVTEQVRRYSHFEIALEADGSLCELGHGAMGTTYRAQDTVLRASVALKVIGGNIADTANVRARFLREARAAARLRHPNVASVFHYGEQEGECFYVMELVEGETLEQRVRRDGPLAVELALEIIIQVARALAAAEARGIVHRDLKPSNVMISAPEDGDVSRVPVIKVIDFGLAKAMAADGQIPGMGDTRGGFVGTPAFASPEQFARGQDERIDTRSDIYSLGVTLWFLLCGKMPFVGKTLTAVHEQQTRRPLPLAQLQTARVPVAVVTLLRSMLAVAPVARPQSARELLDVLHRCQQQLLRASRTRYVRLAGGLGLITLAVAGLALWREHTRPPAPPPDRSVAVLPFENLSPDPSLAFYAAGMQDELTENLANLAELRVIGSDSTEGYPPAHRNLAQIGRELGVNHLIEGSVRRADDQVRVSLRLIDVHDPTHPWLAQYERPLAAEFAIQREVAGEIAARLQATLSPGEKATLDRPPTTDPLAYDLYIRACQSPQLLKTPMEGRAYLTQTIALLTQAVARDPNFVSAYCKLAATHDDFRYGMEGATPEELAVDHRSLAEIACKTPGA